MVLPEDVQTVAPGVMAHRLPAAEGRASSDTLVAELIQSVPIP
jgi:hypothetical protein